MDKELYEKLGAINVSVRHTQGTLDEHTKILSSIQEQLRSTVTRAEFEQYKRDHASEITKEFVQRAELQSLMRFWELVTSNLAKLFAVALVAMAIYFTSQMMKQNDTVKSLESQVNRFPDPLISR